MEGTLRDGDAVIVDRLGGQLHPPRRGDVVVAVQGDGRAAVKRVIGVPGDELEIDGDHRPPGAAAGTGHPAVLVRPGGRGPWLRLEEPYLTRAWTHRDFCCDGGGHDDGAAPGAATVPAGRYFLLGDDRDVSKDSRWFGWVPQDRIAGRVVARYWPPGAATLLDGRPDLVPV